MTTLRTTLQEDVPVWGISLRLTIQRITSAKTRLPVAATCSPVLTVRPSHAPKAHTPGNTQGVMLLKSIIGRDDRRRAITWVSDAIARTPACASEAVNTGDTESAHGPQANPRATPDEAS